MTADLVARELGYRMADWSAGDRATQAAFAPLATFERRFDEVLKIACDLGFNAVDVWDGHLNPDWATAEHVATAARLLHRRGLAVTSLAGWFGATRERFGAVCRIAVALGAPVLGGRTPLVGSDRAWLVGELARHGLRLAIENHPERSVAEMLAQVGDGAGGTIGTTVDTGWYGTQGVDAARAIEEMAPFVIHVHLKDVAHAGLPHETCGYGAGVVPLRGCVAALRSIGYAGAISVEHAPDGYDPRPEIAEARSQLAEWLAEGQHA